MKGAIPKRTAIQFVILLGIVSLFADMTYEGARSITGQFLGTLGATGTIVGLVSGFGEFVSYAFRLVSGYISDKTGKYWPITFFGYILNLLPVPLLAFAGNTPLAATLIITERFGKAIRSPAKDAMLSYATKEVGRGWGFGLHEAMDQIGAIIGPLIVSLVLLFQGTYQMGFLALLIPAICAISVLAVAKMLYPRPQDLEVENPELQTKGFSKKYWLYIAALACVAAGYVDFPLIAFHFQKSDVIPNAWVPIFFAVAMGAAGLSALFFGRLFDLKGLSVLVWVTLIAPLFAPLVFLGGFYLSLLGMVLWGMGLGSQESIMRAYVGNLVSMDKRGTAYGLLNIWFGLAWFVGSALMGFLYDLSIPAVILFSMIAQLAAIPILILIK